MNSVQLYYQAMQVIVPYSRSRLLSPSTSIRRPRLLLIARLRAVCCDDDLLVIPMIQSHRKGLSRRSSKAVCDESMIMKGMYLSISARKKLRSSSAFHGDGSFVQARRVFALGACIDSYPFEVNSEVENTKSRIKGLYLH